jgi:hypothetical protein
LGALSERPTFGYGGNAPAVVPGLRPAGAAMTDAIQRSAEQTDG